MDTKSNHARALFKKDLLTLRRNWVTLCFFIVWPVLLISFFSQIHNFLVYGKAEEKHNFERK